MVKLTEDMVVARSRGSDIHNVKKLNCWGSELSDVSVVRKLPNVEVLSLSVNRISTLADFQYCQNLQELYIRKNNITDINEVLYLRALPKLKSLWLADNPCAEFEQYRLTVLRALPHLQKLDNVAVDSEEVQKAMVCGIPLPADRGGEEREMPRSSSVGESLRSESGGGSSLSDSSPPSSERRYSQTTTPTRPSQQDVYEQSLDDGYEYSQNVYDDDDEQPVTRRQQGYHYAASDPERRISQHSNHGSSPQQYYGGRRTSQQRHQQLTSSIGQTQYTRRLPVSQSPSRRNSQMVAEDSHGDTRGRRYSQEPRDHRWCEVEERERAYSRGDGYGYASPPSEVQQPSPAAYEQRSVSQEPRYVRQGENRAVQQNYDNAYRQAEQHMDSATRSVTSERSSPTKPYPARPKTRNANLLSAVLCLVKELDYTSLEVVEMAVRCRMEELDD
ncbi:dynein axonemal assembly factor 11-like isoform X12 [Portunus trituberculatus]|uniref:dynein axonemal assembly factor 11-like isoform X12 n=1 Tax=Portunus trituberculatus TaxID=210409 RepID=UPI001E1CC5B6|nr:dynein axonemal assembly factor 11-like isoform X12 [Portunus trituberculatus]